MKTLVDLETINNEVCNYFNIDYLLPFQKSRKRHINLPRQVFQYFAYILNKGIVSQEQVGMYNYDQTGFKVGHATVINSISTISNLADSYSSFKQNLTELKESILKNLPKTNLD